MTIRDAAIALDVSGRPLEALAMYQQALAAGELDLDQIIDVVGLCLELDDPGYAVSMGLDMQRLPDIRRSVSDFLDAADVRWGPTPDVEFMRLYSRSVLDGVDPDEGAVERLGRFRTFDWGTYWSAVTGRCAELSTIVNLIASIGMPLTTARRRTRSVLESAATILSRSRRNP